MQLNLLSDSHINITTVDLSEFSEVSILAAGKCRIYRSYRFCSIIIICYVSHNRVNPLRPNFVLSFFPPPPPEHGIDRSVGRRLEAILYAMVADDDVDDGFDWTDDAPPSHRVSRSSVPSTRRGSSVLAPSRMSRHGRGRKQRRRCERVDRRAGQPSRERNQERELTPR